MGRGGGFGRHPSELVNIDQWIFYFTAWPFCMREILCYEVLTFLLG